MVSTRKVEGEKQQNSTDRGLFFYLLSKREPHVQGGERFGLAFGLVNVAFAAYTESHGMEHTPQRWLPFSTSSFSFQCVPEQGSFSGRHGSCNFPRN